MHDFMHVINYIARHIGTSEQSLGALDAYNKMALAATTTLVAAVWIISSCNSSVNCSMSYSDHVTELDVCSESAENTFFVTDVVFCCMLMAYLSKSEGLICLLIKLVQAKSIQEWDN